MIKKIYTLIAGILISLAPLLVFAPAAHAATVTWTGGGADCNWSTALNWSGGVPTAGDTVVFDNGVNACGGQPTNDIPGLSLAAISFINNGSAFTQLNLTQALTITSSISQASSVTTADDAIFGDIVLGANVGVTVNTALTLGDSLATDSLTLGGFTLTFNEGNANGTDISLYTDITGAGTVVYNAPNTDFVIGKSQTYTGTTTLTATGTLGVRNTSNAVMFGTSAVSITNGSDVHYDFSSNTTISNAITIAGVATGSPLTSLTFNSASTGTTLTVPNITLSGNTRFGNDAAQSSNLTINLAGITANSHCIEYLGYGNDLTNGPANGFTNGPTGCVITTPSGDGADGSTPATPDTGFSLIRNNPLATLLVTLTLAASMLVIAKRVNHKAN